MWASIVTTCHALAAVLAMSLLYFLVQMGVELLLGPCRVSIPGTVGSFHSKRSVRWQKSPDHCKLSNELGVSKAKKIDGKALGSRL